MAVELESISGNPSNGEEDIDEEDEEGEDEGEEDEKEDLEEDIQPEWPNSRTLESRARRERAKVENLFRRIQTETVPLRVHDVIIKGNTKTKDSLIEAQTALLKDVSSMQDLLEASKVVNFRLQALDVFDSVKITLDSGPPELPGTANVVVEARSSTIEGTVKYKNIFGYGDLWDASLAYGGDHMAEKIIGLSLGLVSSRNHDLVYTLSWRILTDPSQMASRSIRRQLGHGLLSSLKYTFKIDRRNSHLRPTRGYAFVSTTQIGGLAPDSRSLRFLRQELDLRYAVPLGFLRSALNLGISGGLIFPWGTGFLNMPSPLPERFFLGGNLSPICTLGGPIALYGFSTRGLGPTEPRRQLQNNPTDGSSESGRDYLGGDLAVTAFADFSFDFPSKWCQSKGIHGHMFASAGNIDKLTENAYQNFSVRKFVESFRTSVGVGIVVPTNLFRLEVSYLSLS
ncbi:hypothetical protein GH714_013613 [Hevea brasiliensis]|uniref:POTRA domain-containing protein n=1 Tax=Hevea brasiliensis TaxID=3981 RepID=A0A6A6N2S9_HEVBR|nr:hypothetical protein GH714_013613 [Hevea brasiliensis]